MSIYSTGWWFLFQPRTVDPCKLTWGLGTFHAGPLRELRDSAHFPTQIWGKRQSHFSSRRWGIELHPILGEHRCSHRYQVRCWVSKLECLKSQISTYFTPPHVKLGVGWAVSESERISIIVAQRGSISSSVLKTHCVKGDWCRKSRKNLGLFDPL